MDEDRIARIEKELDDIRLNQLELIKKLSRYEGKFGGILLVVSAIGAAVTLFLNLNETS